MEIACVGNNTVTACPFCDELLVVKGDHDVIAIGEKMDEHRADSPDCDKKFNNLPTLQRLREQLAPHFERSDNERLGRIANNPNNGKDGFWHVVGIRHEATTRATSAAEAIEKCKSEVNPGWEFPEATFIGETLPDVF